MGLRSTLHSGWQTARSTFAKAVLRLLGWRFHTTCEINLMRDEVHRLPPKFVIFGEPHTHWADLPLMLLFFWAYRLPPVNFPVRDVYFKPLLGSWLRWVGAIPVDTARSNGMVDDIVRRMRQAERLIIHIPPSGTRRRTDRWRSGFYHIASQARVPIFMGYLDAANKRFGYAPPLHLSGNVVSDMDQVRAFYADKRGLVPANESVIFLREELGPAAAAANTVPQSTSANPLR